MPLTVAVFDNGSFVDTFGTPGSESDTVQASLTLLGHTVTTFTGVAAGDWTTAGASADVILIPEQEIGSLNPALTPAARLAISSYVSSGGAMIVMGHGAYDTDLLNAVFGYTLAPTGGLSTLSLNGVAAAGTPYAGGPASLPPHSFTPGVAIASLPAGALNLYVQGASNGVFVSNYGSGRVARLGWDWYNAQPMGIQDGGWLTVLNTTANYTAVPEPSAVMLAGVGVVSLLLTAARCRKRNRKGRSLHRPGFAPLIGQ